MTRQRAGKLATIIDSASDKIPNVILPQTTDMQAVATILASRIDGWSDMRPEQRLEIMEGVVEMETRPKRAAIVLRGAMVSRRDGECGTLYWVRMTKTFGSSSEDFIMGQFSTISNHLTKMNSAGPTNQAINEILAFVGGCEPQNEQQATIAVQMALTHDAAMRALAMIGTGPFIDNAKTYSDISNKLLRTYSALAETLNKLQRGGTQIIKHIHVNEGGQAIVADTFNHTPGGGTNQPQQCHGAAAAVAGAAVQSENTPGR